MPLPKGYKHTEESKRKMSLASLGRPKSDEHRRNISLGTKGKKKNWTPEWREKIRLSMIGKKRSPETIKKMRETALRIGKKISIRWRGPMTESHKRKISETRIFRGVAVKEKNPRWKGGVKTEFQLIRSSKRYARWREEVLKRDKYSCVLCGLIGGWNKEMKKKIRLEADHIKSFSSYPMLRFDVLNGRTLCRDCHMKTDNWGCKANV